MTNKFWKESTYAIVKAIKANGNQKSIVTRWKEQVEYWTKLNPTDPDAIACAAWLPLWKVRPFYKVSELRPIWPALAIIVGHTDKWIPASHIVRLGDELEYAELPNFRHNGEKYFIIERPHYWKNVSVQEKINVLNS
jgi:hypothetical protein